MKGSDVVAEKQRALAALDVAVDELRSRLADAYAYCARAGAHDEEAEKIAAAVEAALERADLENLMVWTLRAPVVGHSIENPEKET